MAVSGLLLILLIPVLSLSEATVYYVRPTEPTNTSCPAQPYLTLSQYTNDLDHFFKSNTVFKFLPGTHHMDRPLAIGNLQNISLESLSEESDEYPHLVTQFSCETEVRDCIHLNTFWYARGFNVCCAAIWLHDMHNVIVKRIRISVQMSSVSGIILTNVSSSTIQLNTTCFITDHESVGIAIHKATSVTVYSSNARNCSHGFFLHNTTNTDITKITAMHNRFEGITLSMATNTHIDNITTIYNRGSGMNLSDMSKTYITTVDTAYNGMHGMALQYMSNTHVTNVSATHNLLYGIYFDNVTNTYITKTTATYNGCDIIRDFQGQIEIESSTTTLIYNTSFTDVYSPGVSSTTDPISLPAVIVLYKSTLHVSGCNFTGNSISAVRAHASNITVSGTMTFSNNTVFAAAAFVLISDSTITSIENSHIYFLNNHATNIGGVFYVANSNMYYDAFGLQRAVCFLSAKECFEGCSQKRFTFVNNTAGKGGDILYGGKLAIGQDKNSPMNCEYLFRKLSNISQSGLSLISSDPSRVCLCNGGGQIDCLLLADPTPRSIYPGQTIHISAVVVGQDFGTVAGSVYAQFLQTGSLPQLESGQEVQSVMQHKCNHLYYTIFSQSGMSEAVLVLTARDSYVTGFDHRDYSDLLFSLAPYYSLNEFVVYAKNPVYVNVSLHPCPPGFMLTTHAPFRCNCNSLLQQMHGIQCYIQEQTIGRSGLVWVGVMQDGNGTNETVAASEYCSLDYCNREESNVTLSEPDSQCNYNHSGTLCGGCQPGLSLALGSAQCLQCSNKYLALLIPLTLAGPVLVFAIKLFDLTISQGTLNGLIFYVNIVKANDDIFLPHGQTNPLTVFIAWLNLDLGVETCFFQGLTAYSKAWLQFVFPFYIWSIAGFIIILAKYSDRVAKVMGNNSVPVLATLFLLSYAKLLRTIITALSYSVVYTSHGPKAVWTADGNVDYLGPQHVPLFVTAMTVLLFMWLPYTLLLFLGQWLHRCNYRLVVRMLINIKPFLDVHYGSLKGKHYYWFGALLLARATILVMSALIPANRSSIIILSILVTCVVLTYFGHLVYRNLAVAMFDISFFMNLALLSGTYSFTTTAGGDVAVSAYALIGIAFVQFLGLVFFKVFSILKQNEYVMGCLRKEQVVEDDRELNEQAAIEREMESNSEEQDSDGSGSIESLPTY